MDLTQKLNDVLDSIKELMEIRNNRVRELQEEIDTIERENAELEATVSKLLDTF